MEDVRALVPRTPPEGLTSWEPVRKAMDIHALVYDAVWIEDRCFADFLDEWSKPKKTKMVEVCCTCCGERQLLRWAKMDARHGNYGFLNPGESFKAVGSGDITPCPMCEAPANVIKAAEIKRDGYRAVAEGTVMSAAVVGEARYLVLTGWVVQLRVHRSGCAWVAAIPAEAYVFSAKDFAVLLGWRKAYSGKCGYFTTYLDYWTQPKKWVEQWGEEAEIFGLTSDLVAESCLPNCKLDVYMDSFRGLARKYPVPYLRLYQKYPSVENLLISGLPLVLDDLLWEAWEPDSRGVPYLSEIRWQEARPSRMLGLTREELRLGQDQVWGAFLWRLYNAAKAHGERLTAEDMRNAHALGDEVLLELPGRGPVGKSLRYLLEQNEAANAETGAWDCDDDLIDAAMLLDYWRESENLGRNLADQQVRWPRDLAAAHDAVMALSACQVREAEQKTLAAKFRIRRRQLAKYIFEADGLKIVPACSQRDMQREADELHHCVWTYASRHANGKTAIFFIRRKVEPNMPYYTLELDEKTLTVRQNQGLRHCGRTMKVQAFEDLWISWVRAGARRDDRGRPILPEKSRKTRSA